jgi:hypothetical protein
MLVNAIILLDGIVSGEEFTASILEACPQMVQATTCTRRNAAATAKSQPASFWAWDRVVNLVCAALFVTTIHVYRASRVSHELAVLLSMSAGFFDFPKSPDKTRPKAD